MFGNLFGLHIIWENYIKHNEHVVFPATFFYVNIPIYIATWFLSMSIFSVYNKKSKWRSLLIGLIIGTLVIAIQYAFFPNFLRTSRGVIVVALLLNVLVLSSYRFILYTINGTLNAYLKNEKKYIIIANETEAINISTQLQSIDSKRFYLGFISVKNGIKNNKNLGSIENLKDILDAYKPNEILFSTEDLSMQFIIETMSKIEQSIEYKLVSKNNAIISSTSKNTAGEIYTLDIDISQKKSVLDKIRDWI
jgi:FlaA1/EpsC-like NDP-sugar epimerase